MLEQCFQVALMVVVILVMIAAMLGTFVGLVWCIVKLGKALSVLCIKTVHKEMCLREHHRVVHYTGDQHICKWCGEYFFWKNGKFYDCDNNERPHVKEVQF